MVSFRVLPVRVVIYRRTLYLINTNPTVVVVPANARKDMRLAADASAMMVRTVECFVVCFTVRVKEVVRDFVRVEFTRLV